MEMVTVTKIVLKILGGILVCVSAGFLGFFYSVKDSFRAQELAYMKKAFGILKSEIEFAHNPLPVALYNISQKTAGPSAVFFESVSKMASERSGADFSSIWKTGIEKKLDNTYFSATDLQEFLQLGETLGYLDRSLQLSALDHAISYAAETENYLRQLSRKNKSMFRSIGVIGGILITVILL